MRSHFTSHEVWDVTDPAQLVSIVRTHLNFERFECPVKEMTLDEVNALLAVPQVGSRCIIMPQKNKSGSAFQQMREPGVVAGYMRAGTGELKVLVVYLERFANHDTHEHGFVAINQLRAYK